MHGLFRIYRQENLFKMDFDVFKETVKEITPGKRWQHVLPAVPEWHRQRFIDTLRTGAKIPQAYEVVINARNMTDEAFYDLINSLKK